MKSQLDKIRFFNFNKTSETPYEIYKRIQLYSYIN